MRRALLVVLALAGCTREPMTRVDAGPDDRVRVATFNVRRFFDPVCDSGACEIGDYEGLPSPAYFEERADQLAAAIRNLDADVISLQEIENQACLDALLVRLADVMPYGHLGEIGGTATVDVAVLSRLPLDKVVTHRTTNPLMLADGTVAMFSRELLEVHTHATTGVPVIMFAAHFKSKANDEPARRLAEAQVSARIVPEVAAAHPGALIVLAGDLNDTPGSPPLDALVEDGGLVRLADDLALSAQATYRFNGRGEAIDHLLLAPTPAAVRIPKSSRVWRDGSGYGGSDHAALTSELTTN